MNNNYLAPWHIYPHFEGIPVLETPSINPEIYYS